MSIFSLFNGILLGLEVRLRRVGEGIEYIASRPKILIPVCLFILLPIPSYYYEGLIGGAIIFYLTYLAHQLGEWAKSRKQPNPEFRQL